MTCRVITVSELAIGTEALSARAVVSGAPRAGAVEVDVPGMAAVEVGVWEHTAGSSTDVEADEVFVVVSGHATVVVEDGPTLELAPGVVGILEAGARTTWTVNDSLRKVYITPR